MVRYYNPAYNTLNTQIDRLFEDLIGLSNAQNVTTWTPSTELIDQGNAYLLKVYLPGVSTDDTDIQVTQESISITGKRQHQEPAEGEHALYCDVAYGQFHRFVELPSKIQNTKVDASCEHGILSLHLPKVEAEQNKVVKIFLNHGTPKIVSADEAADESNR